MAIQKLRLTRDQFASFLKDFEQIKQFEKLFQIVDEVAPSSDTTGISIQAGNADASANEALAQLQRMNDVLALIASAPAIENNNSTVTDYIDLNNAAPRTMRTGRLAWNDVDQTVDLGMEYDVTQQIGQETYARVGNTTGITIPNGSVVGFAGATPNALLVAPYLADGSEPSLYALGVMTHDLPDSGEKGYCTTWGFVRDLDTSAFTAGDILYASPTIAGALTNIKPTAPSNVIPMAACIVSDATVGVIFVRPTITQMQYYGIFAITIDYTPAVINTAYAMPFDTTRLSNGVVIGTPTSRLVVPQSGLYQFNATIQLISSSAVNKNVWIWFRANGVDIPNSARIVTVSVNNSYTPVSLNEAVSLAANGYVELMFASDSVNVTIDNVPATAFAPAAPGVVIEVTQVQQ